MDIFLFIIDIISVITTVIIIYVLCKHNKLRTLVVRLALQQVREVSTSTTKKEDKNCTCNCTSQFYIILAFKYHNNRISYIHDIASQKNKIM